MKQILKNNKLVRMIYSKLPQQLKNKDYKYYLETRQLIKDTEYLQKEELEKFQFEKLKEIVTYAWENIEGYRALWEANNFEPVKLKTLEDIKLIPFVTKEMLRDNIDKFTNKNLQNIKYFTTGGSTGIPFGFYEQSQNQMIEWGFIVDMWSRFYHQIKFDTKRVTLRGSKIKNIYEYDPISGLVLSSYDINLKNVKEYIKQIEKYKYPIFHVYPSAIYLMAKVMKDNNLKLKHKFEAIMLGSEPLYDFQKELIKEVFNAKLCYWYGHSEKAILAGNCELDDRFHIYPQYGITEVINGELIGTSFWNYATPFIRYKTMDFAQISKDQCSKCGRNYRLLESIDGRLQEFIVSKSKNLVSMTAINMHDDIFDDLEQFRFYQDTVGLVVFNYVSKSNRRVDTDKIYKGLKEKLTDEFELELQEVKNIEKTDAGKLRFLDQKLNMKEYI